MLTRTFVPVSMSHDMKKMKDKIKPELISIVTKVQIEGRAKKIGDKLREFSSSYHGNGDSEGSGGEWSWHQSFTF